MQQGAVVAASPRRGGVGSATHSEYPTGQPGYITRTAILLRMAGPWWPSDQENPKTIEYVYMTLTYESSSGALLRLRSSRTLRHYQEVKAHTIHYIAILFGPALFDSLHSYMLQ